jgi:hypothetical protein
MLRAQDLSKYRGIALGTSVANVLKLTEQRPEAVNLPHAGSTIFQEVSWWPPSLPGNTFQADSVEQIHFSFYNGKLYKLSVTYAQSSTEGMTSIDLQKSIAVKYGPPTSVAPVADPATIDRYDTKENVVATWEDAEHSFNLVRSSFTERFGLVIYSKRANAEAELAIAETARLEKEEGPQREALRLKKQRDELELAREKNQRSFRP